MDGPGSLRADTLGAVPGRPAQLAVPRRKNRLGVPRENGRLGVRSWEGWFGLSCGACEPALSVVGGQGASWGRHAGAPW
ncbi:hypothetical protein Ssi03_37240 [Sphaerisporangium siamense]|uniref:Uncharacterized protein n=1 Tax=Sphaerisporangium siamense TaxID=795645 RepID=A0A7W7D7A5_9ACTN|nr:hypothetical protein [Sphaerisporangium siamense]MBB4701609.1 hypothetical protein [Sphaerisporangium siamense]GII85734.1 hypothetical protein Ssi03_37240 [Sphaerisporangium siamense]